MIFIYGMARSGTNILMNLLQSNPNIVMSSGEFHKILWGGALGEDYRAKFRKRALYLIPLTIITRPYYFSQYNYRKRGKLPLVAWNLLKYIFQKEKRYSMKHEGHNKYKNKDELYSINEVLNSRTVIKCLNGGICLLPEFDRYRTNDVKHFILLRHPMALFESNLRRGRNQVEIIKSIKDFYRYATEYATKENVLVITYEDLIKNFVNIATESYEFVGRSIDEVDNFRFQYKSVVAKGGKIKSVGKKDRKIVWKAKGEIYEHLDKDIDSNQLSRLSSQGTNSILDELKSEIRLYEKYNR